jgi:hypothetical protein
MQTVEIRIEGQLDENWTEWLENLSVRHEAGNETILTGKVADRAAVYGLIAKLRDLGLTLLSVRCEEES